jgi:tetratricopeptide (TPR) repeat protein
MNPLKQFLQCLAIIFIAMSLTQCGSKTSEEYVQEGNAQSKQGHYNDAKNSYLKAIEKDPKNIEGHYGLGGMYNLEKKYTDAEKAFKAVLQQDPTHFNAWYSLGYTYELMGKKEDAENSYQKYRRLKGQMDSILNKEKP